jgi:hypothetical protein
MPGSPSGSSIWGIGAPWGLLALGFIVELLVGKLLGEHGPHDKKSRSQFVLQTSHGQKSPDP